MILIWGAEETGRLLILSQVVLSFQLPFAIVPLVMFTASKAKMGPLVAPHWLTAVCALIAEWRVSTIFTVPTILKLIVEHPAAATADLSSLRRVVVAAAPVPPRTLRRYTDLVNQWQIIAAARHGKTPAQVTLRWLVQQDRVAAIPRSSRPARQAENLDIFDFALSGDEMAAIHGLAEGRRYCDYDFAPDWDD